MFLDRGHPRFRNFNSAIPVDVIRVKSYVNSFLDPSGVPVRVSINKLYLVPKRVVAGLVGVLRNGGGLGAGESYLSVSAVIANLYMETFEEQAIESAPSKTKIWKCYVDDTFTIMDRDRVDSFLHIHIVQFQKISILPPYGWSMEIPRGVGVIDRNFRRVGGCSFEEFLQRVRKFTKKSYTTHKVD